MRQRTDLDIIREYQQDPTPKKKREAVVELREMHHAVMLRFLVGVTGSPEYAEDIVQEVFLLLIHGSDLDKYVPKKPFLQWLRKVSLNRALNLLKRINRYDLDADMTALADKDKGVLDAIVNSEHEEITKRIIKECIEQLDNMEKEIVRLHYYEEMTFTEIAELLGVHVSTVSRRHKDRIKPKLSECIRNRRKDMHDMKAEEHSTSEAAQRDAVSELIHRYWDGDIPTLIETDLLVDYATGSLDEQTRQDVERRLEKSPSSQVILKKIQKGLELEESDEIDVPEIDLSWDCASLIPGDTNILYLMMMDPTLDLKTRLEVSAAMTNRMLANDPEARIRMFEMAIYNLMDNAVKSSAPAYSPENVLQRDIIQIYLSEPSLFQEFQDSFIAALVRLRRELNCRRIEVTDTSRELIQNIVSQIPTSEDVRELLVRIFCPPLTTT